LYLFYRRHFHSLPTSLTGHLRATRSRITSNERALINVVSFIQTRRACTNVNILSWQAEGMLYEILGDRTQYNSVRCASD